MAIIENPFSSSEIPRDKNPLPSGALRNEMSIATKKRMVKMVVEVSTLVIGIGAISRKKILTARVYYKMGFNAREKDEKWAESGGE